MAAADLRACLSERGRLSAWRRTQHRPAARHGGGRPPRRPSRGHSRHRPAARHDGRRPPDSPPGARPVCGREAEQAPAGGTPSPPLPPAMAAADLRACLPERGGHIAEGASEHRPAAPSAAHARRTRVHRGEHSSAEGMSSSDGRRRPSGRRPPGVPPGARPLSGKGARQHRPGTPRDPRDRVGTPARPHATAFESSGRGGGRAPGVPTGARP